MQLLVRALTLHKDMLANWAPGELGPRLILIRSDNIFANENVKEYASLTHLM